MVSLYRQCKENQIDGTSKRKNSRNENWLVRSASNPYTSNGGKRGVGGLLELVQKAVAMKEKNLMMIDQYKEAKQVRNERMKQLTDLDIEENRERDKAMWKRKRQIAWQLMGSDSAI